MKICNKLMVLGGTGFIGRNLVEYFSNKKNFKVIATYKNSKPPKLKNVKWLKKNLNKKSDVSGLFKNIDIVLQFAATTSGANDIVNRPYIHVTDNAIMNSLILREIYHSNVKHFIFPSCTVMYHSSKKPLSENQFNSSKEINSKYFGVANTKIYIEKMCEFFSSLENKKKYTAIRHSNVYGPYDKFDLNKSHMFGATITKVINAKDNGNITVWGSGREKRDLLYVEDLCSFIHKAIVNQKNNFEIFNAGYGKDFSVNEVVRKIIKHANKNLKIIHDISKPSIPTFLSLNCNKAKKSIRWQKKTNIDLGIKKTIEWYLNNEKS